MGDWAQMKTWMIFARRVVAIPARCNNLVKAVPPDFEEAIAQGKLTLDFMPKNA